MNTKTERRDMLRQFFPLLAAISLQQIMALAVNLVDNFMLGMYSEKAMAAASLVTQIHFLVQMVSAGVGVGVSVLGAQYWGKQEIEPIKRVIGIGMKFALASGMAFTLITRFFPQQILSLLTNDGAVIAEAADYLDIMCWTYLIFAVTSALLYSMQSVQTAYIGVIMSMMTIGINILLNYTLIYGNFGAPEMGIRGAAVATITSRSVELITILVFVLCIDKKLKMKPVDLLRFDRTYLGDYVKASMPVMITGLLWGISQTVQTAILGHISAVTIAANSIAAIISQIFGVFSQSAANAASVIIGKTVGSGRMHLVRQHTRTLQVVFLILGISSSLLLLLFMNPMVGIYHVSGETRNLALSFLLVYTVANVGSCYEYPCEGGIIAGGGDPKYQAICDNLFMWLYTIPVSALSAFVWHFPPVVTFIFLKSDQILKCIPNGIVCNRYKWVRDLTKPVNRS